MAEKVFLDVLRQDPNEVNALQLLGTIYTDQRAYREGAELLRRAIELLPVRGSFYVNYGNALRGLGKHQAALQAYREGVRVESTHARGWVNLALCLQDLGQIQEAISGFKKAIELEPENMKFRCTLARCYQSVGDVGYSVDTLKPVLLKDPDNVEAWMLAGTAYQLVEQPEESERLFRRALGLSDAGYVHLHLGDSLRRQGRYEEAVVAYQIARQRDENSPSPLIRLASLASPIWMSEAQRVEGRALSLNRMNELQKWSQPFENPVYIGGMTQFFQAYHGENDRDLQKGMGDFYRRCCPDLTWVAPHCSSPKPKSGRIRIGVVSAFFDGNTIGRLWGNLIARFDPERFDVHVFVFQEFKSEAGKELAKKFPNVQLVSRTLDAARTAIAKHELDVLWYPEIGMDTTTYFLAFSRLAHMQCVSWGHPMTTGIDTVDYFMSSTHLEAEDAASEYTETLHLMNHVMAWFEKPPVPRQAVSPSRFGLPTGHTLYGCLQSLFKFHPQYDQMWGEILRRDPKGILVLLEGRQKHWTQSLRLRLTRANPDVAHRICFVPRLDRESYLALVHTCDVMLDTPVFCGGNTSLEAFAMGVPLVTLPSNQLRGRITHALYTQIGFDACTANSVDEYIDIANVLGTQPLLRKRMGDAIQKASEVLFHNDASIQELEQFFESSARGG